MKFDFYQEVEKLVKKLSSEYGIDENSYSVHFGENLDYFIKHPDKRGSCGILEPQHQLAILLNRKLLLTLPELKSTFYHEFRHVWQRNKTKEESDKHNIGHWICWATVNETSLGRDAYLFSPTELDANRFERSNGSLDDLTVFEMCNPRPRAFEELRENQRAAVGIAQNEGYHILSEDTAQRLIELSLLDYETYHQWLVKHNRERLHLSSECKD